MRKVSGVCLHFLCARARQLASQTPKWPPQTCQTQLTSISFSFSLAARRPRRWRMLRVMLRMPRDDR